MLLNSYPRLSKGSLDATHSQDLMFSPTPSLFLSFASPWMGPHLSIWTHTFLLLTEHIWLCREKKKKQQTQSSSQPLCSCSLLNSSWSRALLLLRRIPKPPSKGRRISEATKATWTRITKSWGGMRSALDGYWGMLAHTHRQEFFFLLLPKCEKHLEGERWQKRILKEVYAKI